jgi:putative ABC transport system permease protein
MRMRLSLTSSSCTPLPAQVVRMMRIESLIVVGVATVMGTLAAIPSLAGVSHALTEPPIPSFSAGVYAAIIGVTVAL